MSAERKKYLLRLVDGAVVESRHFTPGSSLSFPSRLIEGPDLRFCPGDEVIVKPASVIYYRSVE